MFTWQIDLNAIQEKINNDYMPMLWEWIEITKDYAMDLMERYINYSLFVSYANFIGGGLVLLLWTYLFRKYKFIAHSKEEDDFSVFCF